MTELLIKFFIKDRKKLSDPAVRQKYGTLAGAVGIVINLILFVFKLFAGILSASVAIIADAVNNLSDAGTSIVGLVSFRLAAKPADRDHPFGHARIEYIASMIVSFLILSVGLNFFTDSAEKLLYGSETKPTIGTLSVVILSVSIAAKLWLAFFNRKIAKRIDSSVIKAASADSLFDAVSTTAVLTATIVVKLTGLEIIDAIVGLLVSILIIVAGVKLLNETKNSLLGEAPNDEIVNSIQKITSQYPEIIGTHDMMVHNYGPSHYIASFHAEVNGTDDIYVLHDAIDNAEKQICEQLGILCTIHLDPIVTNDERVDKLKKMVESAALSVDSKISIHDFRAVIGATHTNLIFDAVIPFENKTPPEEIKNQISSEVKAKDSSCFCVITIDRG